MLPYILGSHNLSVAVIVHSLVHTKNHLSIHRLNQTKGTFHMLELRQARLVSLYYTESTNLKDL